MKQFLILTNFLLLTIILFQACGNTNKLFPVKNSTGAKTSFCADSACYSNNGSELEGMINYDLARSMAENYANDIGKKFIWDDEIRSNIYDSKSIWFDLKKIKNFIGFIESKLCKDGCVKTDNYGIRMYFAKYPGIKQMKNISDLYGVPLDYANHHTLFMVPTFWDPVRRANISFDLLQNVSNCNLKPINPNTKRIYLGFIANDASTSREQNHGSLMPPPAASGAFPN